MSTTDNGEQGILQNVDPAKPRLAAEWNGQQNPAQQVSQPVQLTEEQPQPVPTGRIFTEDEVEAIRRAEKDKLYGRINDMDTQLKELKKDKQAQEKARKDAEEAELAEQRRKEEEQMELRELIQKKEQEWNQRFQSIEQERERDRAVFEREKQVMELQQYTLQRIEQESEYILPELRDLVRGNTIEEIDQSIEDMKNRTNAVLGNFAGVASQQPPPRGASPTQPSQVGPMEQQRNHEQLSSEDIRTMDIETYKKYRESLLASASQQYRNRR
jgi:hypothetical protein